MQWYPVVTLKLGYELSYEPAPGSPSVKAALNQTLKVLVVRCLGKYLLDQKQLIKSLSFLP